MTLLNGRKSILFAYYLIISMLILIAFYAYALLSGNIEQIFCNSCSISDLKNHTSFILLNGFICSFIFAIWMLSDLISSDRNHNWKKPLWVAIVIFIPVVGLFLYFFNVFLKRSANEQFL